MGVLSLEIVSGSAGSQSEKGGPGPWLGGHGQSSSLESVVSECSLQAARRRGTALVRRL
jgi:hypothetical protein